MNDAPIWRTVARADDSPLTTYLSENEPVTTVISERFRSGTLDKRMRRGGRFYVLEGPDRVESAVFHGVGGFFYPVGLRRYADNAQVLTMLRRRTGSFIRIHSIMGSRADVDTLAGLFGARPRTTIDYELLAIGAAAMPQSPMAHTNGFSLYLPTQSDWKRILPLHVAYELEEVLPPGVQPNLVHSKATLLESLRNHTVLLAVHKDELVARVATNAHGFRGEQIGGVYTDPRFRSRGVAQWLMSELLARLRAEGRMASLFVKAENQIAIRLYKKLGFSFECEFRIHYFQ